MISKAESLCTAGVGVCKAGATPTEGLLLIRLQTYIQTEINWRCDRWKTWGSRMRDSEDHAKGFFQRCSAAIWRGGFKIQLWLDNWKRFNYRCLCSSVWSHQHFQKHTHLLRKYLEPTSHLRHKHTHHSHTHKLICGNVASLCEFLAQSEATCRQHFQTSLLRHTNYDMDTCVNRMCWQTVSKIKTLNIRSILQLK
jgi:hypothetical protein